MRTFVVSLVLMMLLNSVVGHQLIGVIPKDFIKESEDPVVRLFIIEMWIDNVKSTHPHCAGATFDIIEDTDDTTLWDIYAECYKWEL